MRHIPSLLRRDPDTGFVTNQISTAAKWVATSPAVDVDVTRLYDGVACLHKQDGQKWYFKQTFTPGEDMPSGSEVIEVDYVKNEVRAWVLTSPEYPHAAALQSAVGFVTTAVKSQLGLGPDDALPTGKAVFWGGTYELVGPGIGEDPEEFFQPVVISHTHESQLVADPPVPRYAELLAYMRVVQSNGWAGLVWQNKPTGHMAKLKPHYFKELA